MKYLVTGATGFIGSHLVEKLISNKAQVRALVRETSNKQLLEKLEVELVEGDILNKNSLRKALMGIDIVFHCAALVTDWAKRKDFYASIVQGTGNVLEAAHEAKAKRFIYLSSCEVYGNPGKDNITEDFPLVTGQHPYTDSKIMAEKLVWEYCKKGLPAVILRPATIYGRRCEYLIKEIARLIKSGRMILINQGRAKARLCYVENLADALLLAATHDKAVGQVFNVSDGCRTTWKELVDKIAKILECPPPKLSVSFPAAYIIATVMEFFAGILQLKRRPLVTKMAVRMTGTDQYFSIEKIKRELGFVPRVDFEEGMERTGKWLKKMDEFR